MKEVEMADMEDTGKASKVSYDVGMVVVADNMDEVLGFDDPDQFSHMKDYTDVDVVADQDSEGFTSSNLEQPTRDMGRPETAL